MKQALKKYNEFLKWTLGSFNIVAFVLILFLQDGSGIVCCGLPLILGALLLGLIILFVVFHKTMWDNFGKKIFDKLKN